MTTDELVLVEHRDDSIAIVTLNRPERLNALSTDMTTAIDDTFRALHRDRATSAIILRGNGKGFCAGADLKGDGSPPPDSEGRGPVGSTYRAQQHLADMILAVHECDKPVIAATHGAAVGGGLALALAADMRVATPDTRFGAVFHNLGLSACDVGVSWFLPRVVGPTRSAELMLSGRIFSGEEADRFGMLNRLAPVEQIVDVAVELALSIIRNSEYGVWMTKSGMWLAMDAPSLRHAMELENRTQVLGMFTKNMSRGVEAAMSRTDPDWLPM